MRCKFPYNENFVALAKKHAGGNGNLIVNFAWPKLWTPNKHHRVSYGHTNHLIPNLNR